MSQEEKKTMIVFNMKEIKEKNYKDQIIEMNCDMGVRVREEDIVDVVRMKKEGQVDQLLLSSGLNMISGQCLK